MKYKYLFSTLLLFLFLSLVACANGRQDTSDQSDGRDVQIVIRDQDMNSSRHQFHANIPYTFHVVNKGTKPHNFIIWQRVDDMTTEQPAKDGIVYLVPATNLESGQSTTFTYQFSLSLINSNLQFRTQLPGPTGNEGPLIPVGVQQ